jgi:hypothetical protein
MSLQTDFLNSAIKQFHYYRTLGEQAMAQVSDEDLNWLYYPDGNSIATIVQHLSGNMRSRWTDLLTTDGEKKTRDREGEFANLPLARAAILDLWHQGWNCLLGTLESLQPEDLETIIYIRNQGHTVMEAINRQLSHYPHHVGQIVLLARMRVQGPWQSLSIPHGGSESYNADKFAQEKKRGHFTDEILKK